MPSPAPSSNPNKIWYNCSCHCRQIIYRALLPKLTKPTEYQTLKCSCSICTKNGYLLVYPEHDEVKWDKGSEKLKKYEFATKTKDHLFCGECGSSLGIDFREGKGYGLNARMFKGLDLEELDYEYDDGKNNLHPEFNDVTW